MLRISSFEEWHSVVSARWTGDTAPAGSLKRKREAEPADSAPLRYEFPSALTVP